MNKHNYSSIMMKHVAYKTYFDVTTEDYEFIFKDFITLCERKSVIPNGPITFAVTQVDLERKVNVEIFRQVNKSFSADDDLSYRTYFCLNMMLQGRITSNNFIEDETALLEEMNQFAVENKLTFVSPYYHTFRTNISGEQGWIDVKAKVYENE